MLIEESEPLGFDLEQQPLLPLDTLTSRLRSAVGDPSLEIWWVGTRAHIAHERTEVKFGVALGLFDWLTVALAVPLVETRTEPALDFRALDDANLDSHQARRGSAHSEPGIATSISQLTAQRDDACPTGPACAALTDLLARYEPFGTSARGVRTTPPSSWPPAPAPPTCSRPAGRIPGRSATVRTRYGPRLGSDGQQAAGRSRVDVSLDDQSVRTAGDRAVQPEPRALSAGRHRAGRCAQIARGGRTRLRAGTRTPPIPARRPNACAPGHGRDRPPRRSTGSRSRRRSSGRRKRRPSRTYASRGSASRPRYAEGFLRRPLGSVGWPRPSVCSRPVQARHVRWTPGAFLQA